MLISSQACALALEKIADKAESSLKAICGAGSLQQMQACLSRPLKKYLGKPSEALFFTTLPCTCLDIPFHCMLCSTVLLCSRVGVLHMPINVTNSINANLAIKRVMFAPKSYSTTVKGCCAQERRQYYRIMHFMKRSSRCT